MLTVALARELAGRRGGPDVTVVGPAPPSSAGGAQPARREVAVLSKADVAGMLRLRHTLAELDPDVVHAQDRRAILATTTFASLPKVPVAATYHGLPGEGPATGPLYRSTVLAADAAVARLVAVNVAPSSYAAAVLCRRLKVPADRVSVIPNGVAPLPSSPASRTVRTFASVSTFSPAKAVPVLIEAFARVAARRPSLRLLLVGDGVERPLCQRLVAEAGLVDRVRFTGYCADVAGPLSQADAFVLSSVEENLPLALLEAMSAGLACVCSDVGGVGEALADGAGLLVPPGDVTALAQAMTRLADEPELALHLGRAAADHARRRFSVTRCADEHLDLWTGLLERE